MEGASQYHISATIPPLRYQSAQASTSLKALSKVLLLVWSAERRIAGYLPVVRYMRSSSSFLGLEAYCPVSTYLP